MNITRYKPSDIIAVNGNSLTVFVDISDGILKAKDVRGNVYSLESLSSTLENAKAVFIDPNEDALKYLKDPQTTERVSAKQLNLGWARYDDGVFTESSKLTLANGVSIVLPNNAASIYRSYDGIDYYNGTTTKVLAENLNDVYMLTVVFKCSAPNANKTFLRLQLDSASETPYERVGVDVPFGKGNNVQHDFHQIFQYYADQNFVDNGSNLTIVSNGGAAQIWDIVYFIQKTQSYAP
jgi:hypothetical protein